MTRSMQIRINDYRYLLRKGKTLAGTNHACD
jgi:hypothetical protein